jgi:aerobic-type carbon monoxide dehydrogenase small subunit (CoxS/CutS family)
VVEVALMVNGIERHGNIEPRVTLADFLRDELGLTGTHLGCEHGVCGACTVLLNGQSVRSCLLLAVQAAGADVTTVEGLAKPDDALHPIQNAFAEKHGLQCGFCTPGILMTVSELLSEDPNPDENTIRKALSGNLCRCTGYHHIVEAVRHASSLLAGQARPEQRAP